jgi:hypothetical protein
MVKQQEVQMPADWNDHAGWDAYFQSRLARPNRDSWDDQIGSISIERLPQLAEDLKSREWRTVWIPGCGLSPLAHMLAHLGLEVVATDVSSVAVEFQRGGANRFSHLTEKLGAASPNGSFAAEIHDFRTEFRREEFDLIVNVKAIQGFPQPDIERIAGWHASALRRGCYAYFDTMNVQGERREALEQALEAGGFFVPLTRLNQWYRKAVAETQIPHIFVLGQPMIPRVGEYAGGGPKWETDMERLRKISAEYRSRMELEQQAEQSRMPPDAKIARVIYSTG